MSKYKPQILIFIDWFIPAFKAGGPIQSVLNIVQQLNDSHDFHIVTSDADLDGMLEMPESEKNRWLKKDTYNIIYLDKQNQNLKTYKAIISKKSFDVIYLNSLFSLRFSLLPLCVISSKNTKIILAPRGMLGKGALSIKPLKKKIFNKCFKILGWHKKVIWHATAYSEKNEIINVFGNNVAVNVISNLSKRIEHPIPLKKKIKNELQVFFLSRISIKKNLHYAINILKSVDNVFSIDFTIIGPVEDKDYWKLCKAEMNNSPKHIRFITLGAQPHHKLTEILKEQHLLLLPTRHENFGHVIVESWQNACPVIISDQTPWIKLERKKLGVEIPIQNEKEFTSKVEMFAAMNQTEFNIWSNKSKEHGDEIANDEKLLKRYCEMFS